MKVSVKACNGYGPVQEAISQCLEPIGGIEKFVKKGDRVLLKVNLLYGKSAEHAVCTHPEFVRACIRIVKAAGGRPTVGDSPAYQKAEAAAAKCGILNMCRQEKVHVIDLDKPHAVKMPGNYVKSLNISSRLNNFDAIINMPKLKTHSLIGLTAAVKNLYGCVSGKAKGLYHVKMQGPEPFAEMLLDLQLAVKPKLTIVDAVIGMEGQGPGSGDPIAIGAVIAGDDTIAVDTVAAGIVGMKPSEVFTWNAARHRKLEGAFAENIEIFGDTIRMNKFRRARKSISIPLFIPKFARNLMVPRPVLRQERCISCGGCLAACPAGAIDFSAKHPVFDYSKCIRCYCCHEVCPKKAIPLKSGLFARFVLRILS